MRDSIVIYRSHFEAVFGEAGEEEQIFSSEQKTEFLEKYLRYAFYGIEPDFTGLLKRIFSPMRPQIDANNHKFISGQKGGRPRKTATKPVDKKTKTDGLENPKTTPKTSGFENPETTPKTSGFENKKPPQKPNVNVNVNENVNEYDCLSVSHIGETDGLTDDERAIEWYGEKVVNEAREKKLPMFAAFYLDCARGRLTEAGMNLCEYPASRYLEILEGLGRQETVKIGGATLPSEAVMREIVSLSADPTTLDTALARTTGDGEREVKNKLGYAVSTLYNFAKGY